MYYSKRLLCHSKPRLRGKLNYDKKNNIYKWSHNKNNNNNYIIASINNNNNLYNNEKKYFSSASTIDDVNNNNQKDTKYILPMFPYPSGNLHMGHVRVYTISDCLSRFWRLKGKKVLHPMGWDAFGLPAENAAIERNIDPADWTKDNIDSMRQQLESLDFEFDWSQANDSRGLMTCSPEYYKWTQWIFLQLYNSGLAYRKEAVVNWDPVDKTVLANEQIDADGRSWRSGAIAEQKKLRQWFFRITCFADELLKDLDTLDGWPEKVKQMQRFWIGRSNGVQAIFKVDSTSKEEDVELKVFTTRADTLLGVTFVAISTDHPLVEKTISLHEENNDDIDKLKKYLNDLKKNKIINNNNDDDNNNPTSGIQLFGVNAIHPITNKPVPIYVAEYVIGEYGDAAVMGVPAHDERDYQFAKKHNIPIKYVVKPLDDGDEGKEKEGPVIAKGILENSDDVLNGLTSDDAIEEVSKMLSKIEKGGTKSNYRLRDWLVSRQRFWGTPIPMIHCPSCGVVPVPEDDLPVLLPTTTCSTNYDSTKHDDDDSMVTPLSVLDEWNTNVSCPQCGRSDGCHRDPDTLDTFVDSSWYFLRFCDPNNDIFPFSKLSAFSKMPVDAYIGGIEHAVLHLLYARFLQRSLYYQGMVNTPEPFKQLITQGMVLGKTYKCPETGRYLLPEELDFPTDGSGEESMPSIKSTGKTPDLSWEKMSKSKYNGVEPGKVVEKYGADVTRLASMFVAPPEQALEWDEFAVAGQARWLERIERLVDDVYNTSNDGDTGDNNDLNEEKVVKDLRREIHQTIQTVTKLFEEGQSFNVAIAKMMKLSNSLSAQNAMFSNLSSINRYAIIECRKEGVYNLLLMLLPFAPNTATELLGKIKSENQEYTWPELDTNALIDDMATIVLQIKGKKKAVIELPITSFNNDKKLLEEIIMERDETKQVLKGKDPKRVIVVIPKPKKEGQTVNNIVNFVV